MTLSSMRVRAAALYVLSAATSLVLVIGAAATANAGTWSYPDSAGDAPSFAVDIDNVRVTNSRRAVSTRVRFQDLKRSKLGGVYVVIDTGRAYRGGYSVSVERRRGRFRPELWRGQVRAEGMHRRVRCSGMRVRWKSGGHWREWVNVSVPHRCLRGDKRVRVSTYTYRRVRTVLRFDRAPDTRSGYSRWVRRG